jgi:hypothetical protein
MEQAEHYGGAVTSNERWRRYLDAGAAAGQKTLARAEDIAKGLLATDNEERERAWRDLDDLGRTGRQIGGQLIDLARREVAKHAKTPGSFDDLVDRIAEVLNPTRRGPQPHEETDPREATVDPTTLAEDATGSNAKPPKKRHKAKAGSNEPAVAAGDTKEHQKHKTEKKHKKAKKKEKRPEHVVGGPEPSHVARATTVNSPGRP